MGVPTQMLLALEGFEILSFVGNLGVFRVLRHALVRGSLPGDLPPRRLAAKAMGKEVEPALKT
jgi:hypothetical protein